jgi:hypothetical protein
VGVDLNKNSSKKMLSKENKGTPGRSWKGKCHEGKGRCGRLIEKGRYWEIIGEMGMDRGKKGHGLKSAKGMTRRQQ